MSPQQDLPPFSRTLAEIGSHTVKEDEVRLRATLDVETFAMKDPLQALERALDKSVETAAVIVYGQKQGFEISTDELAKRFEIRKNQLTRRELESLLTKKGLSYSRWKELVEDDLRVQYVLEKSLADQLQVSSSEIESYYRSHASEFKSGESVLIRHIVTDDAKKAQNLLDRINKGENFAQLALDHSIAPERSKGGLLGYFERGAYPQVFDDACFSLNKGDVSEIVKSDYGYHIFKLLDKKPAGTKTIDEVAPVIQQKLFEEKLKKQYDSWLAGVYQDVKPKIYRDRLTAISK